MLYAQSGLVDYLNVYQAHGDTFRGIATMLPNMSYPPAPFLYLASAVKAKTDLPVFHASGIRDIPEANAIPSDSIFYGGGNNRDCCSVMVGVRASDGETTLVCSPETRACFLGSQPT